MTAPMRRAWLGCFGGPLLWFAQQQVLLYFTPLACGRPWLEPLIAAAFLVALTVIGVRSAALPAGISDAPDAVGGRSDFIQWLGALSPPLFAVAMLWQAAATIIYPGCAR